MEEVATKALDRERTSQAENVRAGELGVKCVHKARRGNVFPVSLCAVSRRYLGSFVRK
ncbi:MAG TPA: hypothetical protein H9662_03040 [Firmicutes bacterium]|nr:hypothetical protein [Bacillota bacterium]